MKETKSTCPYCGVGCGVIIESSGDLITGEQITGVRGDPNHPANFGRLCSKGSTLHLTAAPMHLAVRALHPEIRTARSDQRRRASWAETNELLVERFASTIERHGPDSVGFYISGQLLTEDYYVFNKLSKGLIGTNNIDTNSRLCMSSAVAGYKQTLGADAPPSCYDDVNHAEVIFIVGSNTAYAHPILFRRIEDAKRANPQLKIIFADPRKTATAELADLYLPLLPGTDVALFHGMLHLLLWEGLVDSAYIAAHTSGFEQLKTLVRDYTPKMVSEICGIREADLVTAAKWFGASRATLSLYCQGLNQSTSGTAKNAALVNLHLATGQIGKPGAGPFSLTGQPNAMGGREVGGMANLLSAHRDLANPQHRAEVAALWGVASVPQAPGKTAVEMFQAAADGEIKALWIACTNPAQSLPDQSTVRAALERCEFVVLQEAYANTATARYADVLLPASTWGEKEGTVTNSERCITRVRQAVSAPQQARADWAIVVDFARALERRWGKPTSLFNYPNAESIWLEHRESTRGRDLDITGMSYAMLEAAPQQWPLKEGESVGKVRLYADAIFPTDDGRARFVSNAYKPVFEPRDARYPVALTTGRLRDQWHGMSRTGTLGRLFGHVAEPSIDMNAQDMLRRGLVAGDLVHVSSRRGSQIVPVQASSAVAPAQAFMAMHWGEEFLSGASTTGVASYGVNGLTQSAFCPSSKQPELKYAAVKVLKAELPWRLTALAWLDDADALARMTELRGVMRSFAYASITPFGQARTGVLLRAAAYEPVSEEVLLTIERILQLGSSQPLIYSDKKRHIRRVMQITDGKLHGLLLGGDVQAQAWLQSLLQSASPVAEYGRLLMMPSAKAPVGIKPQSPQVCNCFNVTEQDITRALEQANNLTLTPFDYLQQQLKCGTNCGSCIPELKKLVRQALAAV